MRMPLLLLAVLSMTLPVLAQNLCDAGSFFCGTTVQGEIVEGSCPTGCLEYSQSHTFNVFGNTTLSTLTASSSEFASTIEIVDSEGTVVARRDGTDGQTRLATVLVPGIYSARVIAQPAGSSGTYTLKLTCLLGDPQVFCSPDETTLCFRNRFAVTASLRASESAPSVAASVARTEDQFGIFSAPALTNDPDNPELVVKILDGRAINGRWWVFIGGLTGFDYELTIRDTFYKREKTYSRMDVAATGGVDLTTFGDR